MGDDILWTHKRLTNAMVRQLQEYADAEREAPNGRTGKAFENRALALDGRFTIDREQARKLVGRARAEGWL